MSRRRRPVNDGLTDRVRVACANLAQPFTADAVHASIVERRRQDTVARVRALVGAMARAGELERVTNPHRYRDVQRFRRVALRPIASQRPAARAAQGFAAQRLDGIVRGWTTRRTRKAR